MSSQYKTAIDDYEKRLNELQEELSRKICELSAVNLQNAELKKLLEDMKSKLKFQVTVIIYTDFKKYTYFFKITPEIMSVPL